MTGGRAGRKIALVTGGIDRVGAAIAARLAADGWALALHCRATCAPTPALADAIAKGGAASHVFQADLARDDALASLVPEVIDHFGGPPTLLVNCASAIEEGSWQAVTVEALMRLHRINVVAPTLLVRALAAGLGDEDRACVVNILDQRVRNPPVDQAAYTASKLALASLTRVLARAFAPRLRVNAVAPGLTLPGDDYAPGQVDRLAEAMPLDRLPTPADIAEAVVYLANAPAVTGETLSVDGGAALESFRHDFVHMMRTS